MAIDGVLQKFNRDIQDQQIQKLNVSIFLLSQTVLIVTMHRHLDADHDNRTSTGKGRCQTNHFLLRLVRFVETFVFIKMCVLGMCGVASCSDSVRC